jgi:transcriptional regulator with XRE-family HTH domain
MSLQELLEAHGITQPIELARLLGIDRRHAWEILHGKIRLAPRFVLLLNEKLGIPFEQLLRATIKPKPARRGRPRKQPPEGR